MIPDWHPTAAGVGAVCVLLLFVAVMQWHPAAEVPAAPPLGLLTSDVAVADYVAKHPAPGYVNHCAEALVTLSLAAECTAFNATNNSCAFTMADLRAIREASAYKQNYCPKDTTDGSANQ